MSSERWFLGFDAGCTKCTKMASQVESVTNQRLTAISLSSAEMTKWREESLGENAPWAPTVIRINGDGSVSGWTGVRAGLGLVDLLGPKLTWRVSQSSARNSHRSGCRVLL